MLQVFGSPQGGLGHATMNVGIIELAVLLIGDLPALIVFVHCESIALFSEA